MSWGELVSVKEKYFLDAAKEICALRKVSIKYMYEIKKAKHKSWNNFLRNFREN